MPLPKSYTQKEAAAYLSICTDTLRILASKGLIVRYKIGGSWRYYETDLDDYVQQQHQQGYMSAAQLREGKKKPVSIRQYRRSEPCSIKELGRQLRKEEEIARMRAQA